MKKRIITLICSMTLSVTLTVQPVYALNHINRTAPIESDESESDESESVKIQESLEVSTEFTSEIESQTEFGEEIESQTESVIETEYQIEPETLIESTVETESQTETENHTEVKLTAVVSEDGTSVDIKLDGYTPQNRNEIEFDIISPELEEEDAYKVKAEIKDGIYQYKADLKNYKKTGNYKVTAYEKRSDLERILIKEIFFEVPSVSTGEVASKIIDESRFEVKVDKVNSEILLDCLKIKVWSDSEEKCKWYNVNRQDDGSYSVTVNIKDFENYSEKYSVSIYGVLKNGAEEHIKSLVVDMKSPQKTTELKTAKFSLQRAENEKIEINNQNNIKGTFEVYLYLDRPEEEIQSVSIPVWSADDQSDIYWYNASRQSDGSYMATVNISNHQYHSGEYIVHSYVLDKQGNLNYLNGTRVRVDFSAGDFIADMGQGKDSVRLNLNSVNIQGAAEKIEFAVWSAQGGQDDIYWYEAVGNGNNYSADVILYNHKSTGKYYAHAYLKDKNGQMHFLKDAIFEIDEMPEAKIEIKNQNNSKGTFDVYVYPNCSKDQVSEVIVPVWTKEDQSDIFWYTASRQWDGSYKTTVDIKNHQYHMGDYNVHSYVKDKNGQMNFIRSAVTRVNVTAGDLSVGLSSARDYVHLTLGNVDTQGVAEKVEFAVWSAQGGQDDIYWYEAVGNGSSYAADVMLYNHKDAGRYYVHAYLKDRNGNMIFLKDATFEVDEIPEEKMEIKNQNTGKGTFDVFIYLNRPKRDISEVMVPVWTTKDQSDIYWYVASRQVDGCYKVTVDIKNHQYHLGDYIVHSYVKDKNGSMNFFKSLRQKISITAGDFISTSDNKGDIVHLILSDVNTQGCEEKIEFAVWSAEGGQDDIYWYQASAKGNNYMADVMLYNHKSTGRYYAHAYLKDKNGEMHLLKELAFDVKSLPEETVEISNINEKQGTFDVKVYLTRPQNMIKEVIVPVWTTGDQSDIYWYTAARQSDGSYKVTVDGTNHQWHSGRYIVHTYAKTYQDEMKFVKEKNVNMNLGTRIVTEKIDTRSVRVKIYGIDARVNEMKFPTWSAENAQDDLVWYTAQKNSDGTWSAEISSRFHNVAGKYICDLYVVENGKYTKVGGTEFNIDEKWEGTWRWIDGYKRYINWNGEIDNDVSRLVSGPYLIKVYKWSNYLIVYAKDEWGNYSVPVKSMITSCGNSTPTGTFYSPMKFRWLTMVGGSKAQWCTQISGDYLFHSVPYRVADPTTLYTDLMYNWLGTTQSLGCIRLQAGDAKWLYDNCNLGTEIYITPWEDGGPIPKPSFSPIPSWHTWDPTDPTVRYLCEQHGCH